MAAFDTYVCDNRTGVPTFPLVEAQVESITETLNDSEAMSFTIPQDAPNVREVDGIRREIQVRENLADGTNKVAFQGSVFRERGDQDSATFECGGLLSLIGRRYVDINTLVFTSVDQLYLGSQLILMAQDESVQAWRNFNIQPATFTNSGKIRSRIYNRSEHQNLLAILAEFPKLKDGFDYAIKVQPDGARLWTPYFPKRGTYKPEMALSYDQYGTRDIAKFEYSRDWEKLTTQAYCTGGSNGSVKFEQKYEDTASSAYWKAVLQTIVSEGSQKDVAWLLDKATQTVLTRRQPIFQPTVYTVRAPRDWWNLIDVGDTIPLVINRGRVVVSAVKRVVQKKLTIKTDVVDLTFESDDAAG